MFTLFYMPCLNMICLRYEEANKRSSRMLREEDEDIQNRVSDEENEEGSQQSTDIIRPTLQQQTPQNRRGRPAVKKKTSKIFPKTGLMMKLKY